MFTPFCCIIVLSGAWQTQTDEFADGSSIKTGGMIVPNNASAEVVELGCDAETVKLFSKILDNDVFFVCPFAFLLAMVFLFKPCLLTQDLWLFEGAML